MGHYRSEMPDVYESPEPRGAKTGYDNEDVIAAFYAPESPGTGSSCPRCGAKLRWNWMDVDDLLLHIKWHENLDAVLSYQSKPYPGLRM